MPFTHDPINSNTDAIRMTVGDVWCDMELMTDNEYQYLLNKYNQNVNRASIDAARSLLFIVSRFTRERAGDVEVYGDAWAKNYRQALMLFINNPNLSITLAFPYAGGISKIDMGNNDQNQDNVRPKMYIGYTEVPYYGWWDGGQHLYTPDYPYDRNTFKI